MLSSLVFGGGVGGVVLVLLVLLVLLVMMALIMIIEPWVKLDVWHCGYE